MSCNNISTNAGVKIYIAPTADLPPIWDKASLEAITTWEEIAEPSNISARGQRKSIIEYTPLSGNVCKQPGINNNGTLTFQVADVPEDVGQQMLQTAFNDGQVYPIMIEHPDTTATFDVASAEYLSGIVAVVEMAAADSPDSIRERAVEVGLNDYLFVARHAST